MTKKEFMNALANGKRDIIALLLSILHQTQSDYCIIGGLAVNAYAEPVVSLDLDIVVIASEIEKILEACAKSGMTHERFLHSVNLGMTGSDLRIQIQLDERYQDFPSRAQLREVLGYELKVAALEDVLKGKIWAYSDEERRKSKRQKDLADIARLVESHPSSASYIPDDIRKIIM